jgi:hypothetical protein
MANAENLHIVFDDFIDDYVRPWSEYQLPRVRSKSDASTIGECAKRSHTFVHWRQGSSSGRVSRVEHLLNAFHHCIMLQQVSPERCRTAFLDRLKEANIIFKHSVDSFLNHLRGIFADASCELLQSRFFVG